MQRNKQAFTLIELLVVILIIGILTAVALPQYCLAVGKSQYATIKNLAQSIQSAQEVYYLANGEYTANFSNLDIGMPADPLFSSTDKKYIYDWGYCSLNNTGNGEYMFVDCSHQLLNMLYRVFLAHSPSLANERNCYVLGTYSLDDWRNKICKIETGAISATSSSTNNAIKWTY